MAYEISIKTSFSAAHKLCGHEGSCKNLHGHNWTVKVFVESDRLNEIGIVADFSIIKKQTESLLSQLDHTIINDHEDFIDKNPSSENMACWVFKRLSAQINDEHMKISRVKIWETESYCASYSEP
jgi:6-pyruvoyltetrahydropterin/6-carboxytetrahydropterin synthase